MGHMTGNGSAMDLMNGTIDYVYFEAELPTFNRMSIVKTSILGVMFLASFVGNSLTLLQICGRLGPRTGLTSMHLLIAHLAFSDLLVSAFCMVTDAVWASTVQWYAGNVACKLVKFLQLFGLYLSTYITVVIGLDRCLAILDPLGSNSRSRSKVRIMIWAAYLLSFFFSLPQLFIFRVMRGPFRTDFYQCVTFGFYTSQWQELMYGVISMLLIYILPLLTMVTSYTLIFCTVAGKSRNLPTGSEGEKDGSFRPNEGGRLRFFRKAKMKSLRLSALIVAAFIVCWTPYQTVFMAHTLVPDAARTIDERYISWIFFFGFANSLVNPVIYGACQVFNRRQKIRRQAGSQEEAWKLETNPVGTSYQQQP